MSDWKETNLGSICTSIQYGYTESASDNPKDPKFLRITDIQEDFINWNTVPHCPINDDDFLKYKLEIGDICIARTGNSTGAVGFIKDNIKAVFASYLIRYKIDTSLAFPTFINFLLKSLHWKKFVTSIKSGSAQAGANAKSFAEFPIQLPPLFEQKRIADVLSCLNAKIENLRRQNETLEAIAQTLFKHWFIDFEFPNADGKPYKSSGGAMITSELGDIPRGWKVGTLSNEFEIIMGQSPAGSSFNEDKQGIVFFQGRTDFGFRFPSVRLYTTEPSRIAEKFDILVSVRAPVGDINVASEKCCIGRGLAAIKSKDKSYCLHKLKSYKKLFNLFESEGTVFGSINKQSFNDLASIIPNNEVIKNFEILVQTMDKKFYVNNLQIQTLTKTRDTLLPKLMSGQLRVDM